MEITDAPYAAGTPEHGEWVRNVFIPTVSHERGIEDRQSAGAESIGGELIIGPVDDLGASIAASIATYERFAKEIEAVFARAARSSSLAAQSFLAGIAWLQPSMPEPEPTLEEIIADLPDEAVPARPLWMEPIYAGRAMFVDVDGKKSPVTVVPPPPWREPWRR